MYGLPCHACSEGSADPSLHYIYADYPVIQAVRDLRPCIGIIP